MTYDHIRVEPVSTALGAEISGLDLSEPPGSAALAEIRRAFGQYGVIFFRDQQLTPDQHLAFARRIGDIDVNRFFAAVPGHPEIAEVRKEPEQRRNIGNGWHTDHSYDVAPAMGSILYAREVPTTGGDTLFAGMYAAYDALSGGLKATLDGLRACHSSRHVFGAEAHTRRGDLQGRIGNPELATQDAVHPVVIRHPETGRKALYVNPGFTLRFDGWTEEESRPLLDYLYRHAVRPEFTIRFHWLQGSLAFWDNRLTLRFDGWTVEESRPLLDYLYLHAVRPEFTIRFHWREGSLAFWDNRSTWHFAVNDYHGERRLLHRITIAGVPLSG